MTPWILLALFFGFFGVWIKGQAEKTFDIDDSDQFHYFLALAVLSWVSGAVCALFALSKVFS